MAERFGGEFSKNNQTRTTKPNAPASSSDSSRYNLMRRLRFYRFLAYPILIAALPAMLGGEAITAAVNIATGLGVWLAVEITKAGLAAETAYNARAIARRPAWPRKAIGAIIMGASTALGAYFNTTIGLTGALPIGAITGLGMMFSFGHDPWRNKGITAENEYAVSRASQAVDAARALSAEIRALMPALGDRRVELEVENLLISVDETLTTIEDDPSDYRNARRYLGVYLKGARDATAQYVEVARIKNDADAKSKYLALVRELEAGFRKKRQVLLEDNRSMLDVEIDVLRERLASEGITVAKEE